MRFIIILALLSLLAVDASAISNQAKEKPNELGISCL